MLSAMVIAAFGLSCPYAGGCTGPGEDQRGNHMFPLLLSHPQYVPGCLHHEQHHMFRPIVPGREEYTRQTRFNANEKVDLVDLVKVRKSKLVSITWKTA